MQAFKFNLKINLSRLFLSFCFFCVFGLNLYAASSNPRFNDTSIGHSSFTPLLKISSNVVKDVSIYANKFFRIGNDIYSISTMDLNSDLIFKNGGYSISPSFNFFSYPGNSGYISFMYVPDSNAKIAYCRGQNSFDNSTSNFTLFCSSSKEYMNSVLSSPMDSFEIQYYEYFSGSAYHIITCQANENFNTQTRQCQSCPAGQSWDAKNNICFNDCTDKNSNKWGFSNGTPQGQCIDCSDKKTSNQVVDCFCMGASGSAGIHSVFEDYGNGFKGGSCEDGSTFPFKDPTASPVDNNQTTDPTNPKPDNNSTTPTDPNNGGTSGGSGGSSGGGNTGSQTTPNPDKPNGSGNGKDGNTTIINNGGGGDKGNDFGTFDGKIDYKDLQSKVDESTNDFSSAISKFTSDFDGFKDGVGQFIDNVTGNGLSTFERQDIPASCAKSFKVPVGSYEKIVEFDLCKIVEPLRPVAYYIFYVLSFVSLLVLSLKLIIFAF